MTSLTLVTTFASRHGTGRRQGAVIAEMKTTSHISFICGDFEASVPYFPAKVAARNNVKEGSKPTSDAAQQYA